MERREHPGSSAEPAQTSGERPSPQAHLRLAHALSEVQTAFILGHEPRALFDTLLAVLLELTQSTSGVVSEVLVPAEGAPRLHVWAARTALPAVLPGDEAARDFPRLSALWDAVRAAGRSVREEGAPGEGAVLGLPLVAATEVVGLVGLAHRPGGYDAGLESLLEPVRHVAGALLEGLRHVRQRQRAEEAERRSAENFRTLLERSPDAIFVHHGGTLLFANDATVRMLGYADGEELRGRGLDTWVMTGGEALRRESSEEGGSGPREVHFRHRDGHRVVGEVVTVPLAFEGRAAVVCLARDVTAYRQVQEKLRATERMVSLGTLAAGVAHEINNPLSYLLSNLHFVDDELTVLHASGEALASERGRELRDALKEALAGSQRVRDIVRDLKMFSRDTEDARGLVDVRGVLDSCVNMAWSEIRHRARLEKDYGEVPPVEANESRLGQIFLNLLVNAAQAITHGDVRGNEIRITTHREGGEVVVAIQDTGGGISEEHRGRLFEPFFTTKPVGVGTGLGLSICHGIVTGLGGRITVDSQLGHGTTFRVFLPIKRPEGVSA